MSLYSRFETIADGTTGEFTFGYKYILPGHIQVRLDDVLSVLGDNYTLNRDASKVVFPVPPAPGTVVSIKRVTPETEVGRVAQFNSGSGLTALDLNNSAIQNLYILQERLDDLVQGIIVVPVDPGSIDELQEQIDTTVSSINAINITIGNLGDGLDELANRVTTLENLTSGLGRINDNYCNGGIPATRVILASA